MWGCFFHRYLERQIKSFCNASECLQGRVAVSALKARDHWLATANGFSKLSLRPSTLNTFFNNSFDHFIFWSKHLVLSFSNWVLECLGLKLFECSTHKVNITYKLYYCK